MGFIHEGVRLETKLMNEAQKLRDLLDGSMDPSELESYKEYYKLAEKITGLALLGDSVEPYSSPMPCAITGKLTTRKQHLARMY